MSHNTGTIQLVNPVIEIGPDSGAPANMGPNTWLHSFAHVPAPSGTKFVILHFINVTLPANNRVEVDLGYDMDVFTSADGSSFWTRPVNIHALAGGLVPIRYITDGANTGSVTLDRYGRGERLPGTQDPGALSNSDPFLPGPNYVEPIYDPFWFCGGSPPDWENVACLPGGDIRTQVADSVGMIVTVHDDAVSTCSVTCIGPDLVITAGHCLAMPSTEVPSSSVIFNYRTTCLGSTPGGYAGRFFKVLGLEKYRWSGSADYAILQIKVPPGGIGVPAIPLRNTPVSIGENVFCLHHPNGAVKKLSIPHPGYATITNVGTFVRTNVIDVSGGSSGSGLFDTSGRYVGVLSHGTACNLNWYSSTAILNDIATTPAPPSMRRVMLVVDRSGSMSAPAGTGNTKMEEARDAASLFIELIRAGGGNELGLVSYSTVASLDFGLADVTAGNKLTLIGPAPYVTGIVGGLSPGGNTSIGDGLDAARLEYPAPSLIQRTILLLTDGLQNTPPSIETVEPSLAGIELHAIGFGTEANLNGTLLNTLAQNHGGLYKRAGSGLELRKFFALAFGDIFEAGALLDPALTLQRGQREANPIPFNVCTEEAVTAVVGWENPQVPGANIFVELQLRLETPSGAVITRLTPGVESSTGISWSFLRLRLPFGVDHQGEWKLTVFRDEESLDFEVNYFVNILAAGGPKLRRMPAPSRFYTGDSINPAVILQFADESVPAGGRVSVTVSKPAAGAGNILTDASVDAGMTLDGDLIPPRYAKLMELESQTMGPLIGFETHAFELSDAHRDSGTHLFEDHLGVFGKQLDDLLDTEGNYTFHARATYGEGCVGTRDLFWSVHVDIGIDSAMTEVTTQILRTRPDGRQDVIITVTPKDQFGNYLGPGRGSDLGIEGNASTTLLEEVRDNGRGVYELSAIYDPSIGEIGVVFRQPDRAPVVVPPPDPSGLRLHVSLRRDRVVLRWVSRGLLYDIYQSANFKTWELLVANLQGVAGQEMEYEVSVIPNEHRFFRVREKTSTSLSGDDQAHP